MRGAVEISLFYGKDDKNAIECPHCGYKIVEPYPKDKLCPKCRMNYLNITELILNEKQKSKKKKKKKKKGDKGDLEAPQKPQPKEFVTKETTLPSKLEGKVKVKKKIQDVPSELDTLEIEKIELKKGEYIKLIGITSVDRIDLFCSNDRLEYLLELTNNLNFIATSILGGELDKMLLISEDNEEEKCQDSEVSQNRGFEGWNEAGQLESPCSYHFKTTISSHKIQRLCFFCQRNSD